MRYERMGDLLRLAITLSGTRAGLSVAEIADSQRVHQRTAERMLAALRDAFPQIESIPGDGRSLRWRLPQGALRGILATDAVELLEIESAARRLREEGAAEGRAEALETVAAKIRAALRPELLRRTETDTAALMEAEGTALRPGPRPHVAEHVLKGVRDAMLKLHRLRITYASGALPPPGRERIVEPLGVLHGQRPYLVAQIAGRAFSPAVFRLDRIMALEVLPDPFVRPASFSLQDYAARSFGVWQELPIEVTLRFTGTAAEEAMHYHFHPTQTRMPQSDGSLHVRFTAGGRLEMMQHFVTWGTLVEVIEPALLRAELAAWCGALAEHHRAAECPTSADQR